MKKYTNPDPATRATLLQRPSQSREHLQPIIDQIFRNVRENGDRAVLEYSAKFDGAKLSSLRVGKDAASRAGDALPDKLKSAIQTAKQNIEQFHLSQIQNPVKVETTPGVQCWQESRPIQTVGLYVPGGSAPLFSTVLMLGIPAKIAGCEDIVLCTPPDKNGNIDPAILYTAQLVGINQLFAVGGAQAIAAMAFGTESIPAVQKIFGPGNQYVTAAKQQALMEGVLIDMPAGPSEVLVFADKNSNPDFVAADLLSQAEHGPDSQVVLVSTSKMLLDKVEASVTKQLRSLPRRDIAEQALENSVSIFLNDPESCIALINDYAPEHLIINVENAREITGKILNAGSVFIGPYSPESAGDYASGTNHTLPTNGFAKTYSGVSLSAFTKQISFQDISREGLTNLGSTIQTLAEAEGLDAHSRAVSVRLKGNAS